MRRHKKRDMTELVIKNPGIDSLAIGEVLNIDPSGVTQFIDWNLPDIKIERGSKRARFFPEGF